MIYMFVNENTKLYEKGMIDPELDIEIVQD